MGPDVQAFQGKRRAALVVVTMMFCLAGFAEARVKPVDPGLLSELPPTPAQQDRLRNMPQKQIFWISKGPKVYYAYADATGCGCLYAGNQQNYQNC